MKRTPEKALIVKFGGSSSTTMEGANPEYFLPFFNDVKEALTQHYARLALIIGGGPRVRALQAGVTEDREKDQIGIRALREHAAQLRTFARESGLSVAEYVPQDEQHAREIVSADKAFAVAFGGLKVGQSTDTVAITAAEIFQDEGYEALVVVLSNIARIFTADPKLEPNARPIRRASLDRLVEEGVLVNDPAKFRPGMNVTLDPVAVHRLQQRGTLRPDIWFGHGQDRTNVAHVARRVEPNDGTQIVSYDLETEYYEAS